MEAAHANQPYRNLSPRIRVERIGGMLAYAVSRLELHDGGIRAFRREGFSESLTWTEVDALAARVLPREAPFHGVPFLDIIPSASADTVALPLRVVPSTSIHFIEHRTSVRFTSVAMLRRMILRAIAIDPTIGIDDGTLMFAKVGRSLPEFESSRDFLEYDARWL